MSVTVGDLKMPLKVVRETGFYIFCKNEKMKNYPHRKQNPMLSTTCIITHLSTLLPVSTKDSRVQKYQLGKIGLKFSNFKATLLSIEI